MPRTALLTGLPPLLGPASRVLVLGSMPGAASLGAGEYYAHPRNAFWDIIGRRLGFDPSAPYADRSVALLDSGIALWDVIGACRRHGSLDAAIEAASIRINPIAELLAAQPSIHRVATNGTLAARLFDRHVASLLTRPVEVLRLPSTSPANASWSLDRKRAAWQGIFAT
jgi:hypoxanthine-DNA glycosylase